MDQNLEVPPLKPNEQKCLSAIRNRLMNMRTTSIRDIMRDVDYKSPRTAADVINRLIDKGYLRRNNDGQLAIGSVIFDSMANSSTVQVPLISGTDILNSAFSVMESRIYAAVSIQLAVPPHRYFLTKIPDLIHQIGEWKIQPGDFALVRAQKVIKNGDVIAAVVDSKIAIRELHLTGKSFILKGNMPEVPPIVMANDFIPEGVVVAILPKEIIL